MSKPNNSIANIKLPGENSQRPIIPYSVTWASNSSYQVTLPSYTPNSDDTFITSNANNSFYGSNYFDYSNGTPITIEYNRNESGFLAAMDTDEGCFANFTTDTLDQSQTYTFPNKTGEVMLFQNDITSVYYFKDAVLGTKKSRNTNKEYIISTRGDTLKWEYFNNGSSVESYSYSFPKQDGVLGLQIDIVDLTSL